MLRAPVLKSFSLKPSRTYFLLLTAIHALAVVSIILTSLPLWACAGLTLAVTANFLLQQRTTQRSFTLDKTQLLVSDSSGDAVAGELCASTLVMPLCVVLCVRQAGRRLPVCQVIFADAMNADDFRDLRVRLRLDR
ncbi:MAG: hypothetical protein A2Z87_12400 [Gallionellales bacterium GWA2_54_124]|nr:MAG: hypothetical protein A2Z87_12400 [Gallionellales bacterium GWA2_54_124]